MSHPHEHNELARAVFAGLTPTPPAPSSEGAERDGSRLAKGMLATMPLVLAGAMTVTMNVTGPIEPLQAQPKKNADRPSAAPAARTTTVAATTTSSAPTSSTPSRYTVKAGDTVSGIAAKYGLSTASVLSLNGLGWKSLIFPGQVLTLTKSAPSAPAAPKPPASTPSSVTSHTVKAGDTISKIAAKYGLSTQKVLDANKLGWSSIIYPGQKIVIPRAAAPAPSPTSPADPVAETPSEDAPSIDIDPIADIDPAPLPEPAPEPAPAPTPYYHVVVSGDTISKIAAKYGLSTQKVLDANKLSWSSVIYPGQKVLIPGKTGTAPAGSSITPLSNEMTTNAQIIVDVGRSLGVSDRGIVIALAAAMQESSLRNIDYGDRDSVGLFQQRPSAGWGTVSQLTTPSYAAQLFYGGPKNPNKGKTRGLLDIPNWQSMSVTQAAQAVQISAYPNAYAKWEASAWVWLDQLG